jgi:DNA-binding MarR family transcriptional regulator
MPRVEILTHVLTEPEPTSPRSLRRATARRASNRRATAREHQIDTQAQIIGFLVQHPESTVGDTAKGLGISPKTVAVYLTRLAHAGKIEKATHGYIERRPARVRRHRRQLVAHTEQNMNPVRGRRVMRLRWRGRRTPPYGFRRSGGSQGIVKGRHG